MTHRHSRIARSESSYARTYFNKGWHFTRSHKEVLGFRINLIDKNDKGKESSSSQ